MNDQRKAFARTVYATVPAEDVSAPIEVRFDSYDLEEVESVAVMAGANTDAERAAARFNIRVNAIEYVGTDGIGTVNIPVGAVMPSAAAPNYPLGRMAPRGDRWHITLENTSLADMDIALTLNCKVSQ